jgi:tetratricopeptide (TPR) repeat protein
VVEHLERALAIYRTLGDEYRERQCRVSLANVYLLRGGFEEVLRACDAVLPFFRASQARYAVAECQYLRGVALYAIGRLLESLEAWDETVAICQDLGIAAAVEVNLMYRGQVLRALERYAEALRDLDAACATIDRLVKPRALTALAELWLDQGDLDGAYRAIDEAIALVQAVDSRPHLGIALRLLGQIRAADTAARLPAPSDALPDAETCFKTSAALLDAARYESELGLTYARHGAYQLDRGGTHSAQALLRQAQTLARRCGMAGLLTTIERELQRCGEGQIVYEQGQVRVRLARQGTPRGRPLRSEEFAEIVWTIESAEDHEARRHGGKVAERRARLRRLCAEALAQGAEPTIVDLAEVLGVTGRTVDRDIASLRAAGELVTTRGASA